MNVNRAAGLTFSSTLRAFLRQDPDVIMVGEMRDAETAAIGMRAAHTGHLVLSTLHTEDAPATLARLRDLKVSAYAAASVRLIVAQRLARRLCPECRQSYNPKPQELREQGIAQEALPAGTHLFRRSSSLVCRHCVDGYRGRVGLFQVMPISTAQQELILNGAPAMEIEAQAALEGIADLRASGWELVRQGVTSVEEVKRVIAAGPAAYDPAGN
ncbi:GspE/PulE family protein [Candidatus Foliamicus sp.]